MICFAHSEPHCWLCADTPAGYPLSGRGAVFLPFGGAQTHDQPSHNLTHPHDAAGSLGGFQILNHVQEQ